MEVVTTYVHGGIEVGSEAGSLGIIHEAAHGRVETAASSLEVHIGKIAVDAISIVGIVIVLNPRGILRERN